MTTSLHQQIAAIAENDPAIYVSHHILINLITNSLDKAASESESQSSGGWPAR